MSLVTKIKTWDGEVTLTVNVNLAVMPLIDDQLKGSRNFLFHFYYVYNGSLGHDTTRGVVYSTRTYEEAYKLFDECLHGDDGYGGSTWICELLGVDLQDNRTNPEVIRDYLHA